MGIFLKTWQNIKLNNTGFVHVNKKIALADFFMSVMREYALCQILHARF